MQPPIHRHILAPIYSHVLGWRFDIRSKNMVKTGNLNGPPSPAFGLRTDGLQGCLCFISVCDILVHFHCCELVLFLVNILDYSVHFHLKGGCLTNKCL